MEMALLPLIFDNFDIYRPSSQSRRMRLSDIDLLMPLAASQKINTSIRVPVFAYYHPRRSEIGKSDAESEVGMNKDKFQVSLDVQHFSPEEITVKTSGGNTIIVEAKHEKKQEPHGHVSRQFVRKYVLPKGHDVNAVQSKLSSDGVLTITAPRNEENKAEERTIPIQQSNVPSQFIENKKTNEQKPEVEENWFYLN